MGAVSNALRVCICVRYKCSLEWVVRLHWDGHITILVPQTRKKHIIFFYINLCNTQCYKHSLPTHAPPHPHRSPRPTTPPYARPQERSSLTRCSNTFMGVPVTEETRKRRVTAQIASLPVFLMYPCPQLCHSARRTLRSFSKPGSPQLFPFGTCNSHYPIKLSRYPRC